jgi:hypothetical protein
LDMNMRDKWHRTENLKMIESQSVNEGQHLTETQSLIQNSNDGNLLAIPPLHHHHHLMNFQNQVVEQHSEKVE